MTVVTVHHAKTHLSKLIARAEAGEEIVIARGKEPVVRLERVGPPRPQRVPGRLKGIVSSPPDSFFFDPMPEDELALWEGRGDDVIDR